MEKKTTTSEERNSASAALLVIGILAMAASDFNPILIGVSVICLGIAAFLSN